jgi:actin-like ATPase involved in cell morphogenesis
LTGAFTLRAALRPKGLAELIAKETKMQVHLPENPMEAVAIGTAMKLRRAR